MALIVISLVCLILMSIIIVFNIINCLNNNNKIKTLLFGLLYICIIPLFMVGTLNNNSNVWYAFVEALQLTINIIVLKFDYNVVISLINDSKLYEVFVNIAFVLCIINSISFVISLSFEKIIRLFSYIKCRLSKRIYIVVGYNKYTKYFIDTISDKHYCVVLLYSSNEYEIYNKNHELSSYLTTKKIYGCLYNQNLESLVKKVVKKSFDNVLVRVIVNTNDELTNIKVTNELSCIIKNNNLDKYVLSNNSGLHGYVYCEPHDELSFTYYESLSKGLIRFINRYDVLAFDFMEQYPLTKFMPSSFINGNTTTLVNDACLNVIFIGFGKVNKQLFLTSVANNQFTTLDNGKIKEKLVNYYIYDKEDVLNDLTLNHNYFRIEKELYQQFDNNTLDESDYLPRPNKIANTNFVVLDINDPSFYNSIKDVVCKNNTLTYIVVSYSNDLDNLDLTIKLSNKISEWNYNNIKLFVKISDDDIALNVLNSNHANYYNFTIFGNKLRTTCSFDKVIRSKFDDMAINRHMMYSLENFKDKDEYSVKLSAYNAWYNYTTVQRESNKYSILGIRYKLQLLGFDIDYEQSSNPDAKDIFLSIYEKDNKIIYNENNKVVYSVHNIENTTRYNLAYLEHLRWNAYMISRGMIPSPISLIKKGITKDFNQRIHSNITTMEGLYMYREILSKALNIPLIDADVIKYDYQVMDDVIRILYSNSLKIIKTCNK